MWARIGAALPELAPNPQPVAAGAAPADTVHSYRADVGTLVIFRGTCQAAVSIKGHGDPFSLLTGTPTFSSAVRLAHPAPGSRCCLGQNGI